MQRIPSNYSTFFFLFYANTNCFPKSFSTFSILACLRNSRAISQPFLCFIVHIVCVVYCTLFDGWHRLLSIILGVVLGKSEFTPSYAIEGFFLEERPWVLLARSNPPPPFSHKRYLLRRKYKMKKM